MTLVWLSTLLSVANASEASCDEIKGMASIGLPEDAILEAVKGSTLSDQGRACIATSELDNGLKEWALQADSTPPPPAPGPAGLPPKYVRSPNQESGCYAGGENEVYYITTDELLAREARAAALEHREVATTAPPERIHLVLKRTTIGAASDNYTVLLVLKDGEVIAREIGPDDPAEVPGSDRLWWNIMSATLPEGTAAPFEIQVVNRLSSTSCSVYVSAEGHLSQDAP